MSNLHVYTTPIASTHTSPLSFNSYQQQQQQTDEEALVDSITSSDEEDINDYRQGGYHVVQIGDTFDNDRYIIKAKMGWGYFSTVWLAKDTVLNQHVALKIVKSDPHFCKSALEEIELLEQAQQASTVNQQENGHQYVAQLLHHFWIDTTTDGNNGEKHVCMVFEVLGENLLSVMKRFHYRGLPVPMVKRITRQILEGLAFLHDTCGIVHTDIKPENILIWIPDVETYLNNSEPSSTTTITAPYTPISPIDPSSPSSSSRRVKRKTKRQEKRTEDPPITGKSGTSFTLENHLSTLNLNVSSQPTPRIVRSSAIDCTVIIKKDEYDDAWHDRITVKMVDLGNACRADGRFNHVIQTRQYRSPEVIVGMPWNDRADIWSLGCLVFELLTGDYLFDPKSDSKYGKDDDHLAKIIELTRVVPRTLTIGGDYSREFFNQKGELRHAKNLRYRRLRDVLHDTYFMPPDQADSISEFLSPMLEVDMAKRSSAKDMLKHQWLV
ncbi:kinase-like domain-containing protein [Halteromyces radiatus]|uniref:kinase-like domain-containing protein n=1 Tax=Halteromyces radiatus TaxID=101107 RepID=UPI00221FDB6F|nr:kinase-like domain-containing protein [Halteromyces radiatus]KAI8084990.1 kinase-like domain-containing protein [Halteromyces radiatus]